MDEFIHESEVIKILRMLNGITEHDDLKRIHDFVKYIYYKKGDNKNEN